MSWIRKTACTFPYLLFLSCLKDKSIHVGREQRRSNIRRESVRHVRADHRWKSLSLAPDQVGPPPPHQPVFKGTVAGACFSYCHILASRYVDLGPYFLSGSKTRPDKLKFMYFTVF
jgi:hypothetical protein